MTRITSLRGTATALAAWAALTCNKWSLERLFAPDEEFTGRGIFAAALLLQAGFAVVAIHLGRDRLARRTRGLLSGVAIGGAAIGSLGTWAVATSAPQARERAVLARVERVEALYLDQSKTLKKSLDRSAGNLGIPDHHSHGIFADTVVVSDIEADHTFEEAGLVDVRRWRPSGEASVVPEDELSIWAPLWDSLDYLEWGRFFIHMADFRDSTERHWDVQMRFNGSGVGLSGERAGIRGEADATFERTDTGWKISRWITRAVETQHTENLLFSEVLDDVVPNPRDRHRARHSRHDTLTLAALTDSLFEPPHRFFSIQSFDRAPGLAVVDVNLDGRDDLYIMERWGPNQLLVDRGDGTFEDRAKEYGLDLSDHSTCALFGDFDNDGDPDLFLGRSLAPSLYFENTGDRFEDRSHSHITGDLPQLAASIAAADYDNDGLLDLYISTYFAQAITRHSMAGAKHLSGLRPHLPARDLEELERRIDRGIHHVYLNRTGPRNVLLHNDGDGRFSVVDVPELDIWLNTYQSTWGDHDGDGKADLYIANDFGLNNLVRNLGDGEFEDITNTSETADIGFGMGASWGDYDGDGDPDLYVANMFSKAGQRITSLIPDLDPAISAMARGNSLFRNDGDRFEKVSGPSPPDLAVEWGGWSWGGQFCDLDRDGCLDIHTLAGYYTAPKAVEIPVDT